MINETEDNENEGIFAGKWEWSNIQLGDDYREKLNEAISVETIRHGAMGIKQYDNKIDPIGIMRKWKFYHEVFITTYL